MIRKFYVVCFFKKTRLTGTEWGYTNIDATVDGKLTVQIIKEIGDTVKEKMGYDSIAILNLIPLDDDT